MKVSKESMIGLLAAVELYLSRDHEADAAKWSAIVDAWLRSWQPIAPHGVTIARSDIGEAGEPIPRILARFTPEATIDRDGFVEALKRDDPVIEVVLSDPTTIALTPYLLQEGQDQIVETRVADLLSGLAGGIPAAETAVRAM